MQCDIIAFSYFWLSIVFNFEIKVFYDLKTYWHSGKTNYLLDNDRKDSPGIDFFLPSMCIIAFGGTGIQLGNIHISNLFPTQKSFITCLIIGAVQLSFSIFGIFAIAYDILSISKMSIMLTYSGLVFCTLVLSIWYNPDAPFQLRTPQNPAIPTQIKHRNGPLRLPSVFKKVGENLLRRTPKPKRQSKSGESSALIPNDLNDRSFCTQLFSWPFILLVLNFSIGTLWANSFVGSLSSLLAKKGVAQNISQKCINVFNVALPAGIVCIPLIGFFLEKYGFLCVMVTGCVASILYTVLFFSNSYPVMLVSFGVYAFYRTLLFALSFSYLGEKFGFTHFGALSGVMLLGAAISGLLQSPLNEINDFYTLEYIQVRKQNLNIVLIT